MERSKISASIIKLIIFFAIIILNYTFPTYATESSIVLPNVEVEVNPAIMKMQERKLPSTYLGSLQRNYTSYNMAEKLKINAKNQGNTQLCWACSSNTALETTINLANQTNYIFSHEELGTKVSDRYGISVDDGGNSYIAYGYYTSGELPVDMEQGEINLKIEDYTLFPSVYKKIEENTVTYKKEIESNEYYSQEEVEDIRDSIKNHILNHGAVTALTYSDINYFSENLQAYYCNNNNIIPNHQVTIIGWNDNYSKENFNENNRPKNNGAYIVLNSYGEEFGNDGLFYISYEDIFIEYSNFGITKTSFYAEEENIYQYDELGINNKIEFKVDAYAANVYTRKTKKIEQITSVSFSSLENGEYEIYINPDSDELNIDKMKKVKEINVRKSRIYNSRNRANYITWRQICNSYKK